MSVAPSASLFPDGCGDDATHGRYKSGCRCGDCRAASAAYTAARRAAWRANPPDPAFLSHGRPSTYTEYGCRCGDCAAAMSDWQRGYRERQKAAS